MVVFSNETLAHHLIYGTVRIEIFSEDDELEGTGTAFAVQHVTDQGIIYFLVTNKHVVKGAKRGRFFFTKAAGDRPEDGVLIGSRVNITLDNFEKGWHGHPSPEVDIAVMSYGHIVTHLMANGERPYIRPIPQHMFPSQDEINQFRIMEDVVFIGYPIGLYDKVNLFPLVRHGTTATPPAMDYEGQPQVLIDASVFPGSSGSPVFVASPDSLAVSPLGHNAFPGFRPIRLLGIIASVFQRAELGPIIQVPIPTSTAVFAQFNQMIDVGVVFKSSLIAETIEHALKGVKLIPPPAGL